MDCTQKRLTSQACYMKNTLTRKQQLALRRASRRSAVIGQEGLSAWRMPEKVVQSRGVSRNVPRWEHRHYRYDRSLWDED